MGVLYPLETLIANFFVKQAVQHHLGTEYLGLQNVYTNFCDILTFAFAGIGIAMMFRLYKPIEEQDEAMVAKLFHFFEKVYRSFVLGAAGVGLLFTGLVILSVKTDAIGVWEVVFGFLLYLLSSLIYNRFYIYYFYLSAWQKRYAACLIHSLTDLLALGIEIGCLVVFKNYMIFLASIVLKNIVEAVIIYGYSNRKYPLLKDRTLRPDVEETKGAFRDTKHMIIAKIGNLLVGSTDSILISGLVSTFAAGCYSGYYFLYLGLTTLTTSFYESIMNRVGKLLLTQSKKNQVWHFVRISLLNMAICAIVVTGFYWIADDFITLWMGESLLLGRDVVLLVSVNLYMCISRHSVSIYRQAAGLFRNASWMILAWGISNLVLSIILGKFFGMFGILLATSITNFLTIYWYEPFLTYQFFRRSFRFAILYEVLALLATASTVHLTGYVVSLIPVTSWLLLIVKTIVLLAVSALWLILIIGLPYYLYQKKHPRSSEERAGGEKISVIIAVYNVGAYIADCIESVLAQSYPNFEILLVDDGSSDEGGAICDAYQEKDARIHVIHQKNAGLSAARNAGTKEATGAYLCYVDGDDMIHPDYLISLYENLKDGKADVSVVSYGIFRESEEVKKKGVSRWSRRTVSGKRAAWEVMRKHKPNMITAWGKLYDSSLKEALMYPRGRVHEDEFTTYKVFYHANRVVISRAKLYGLRDRAGSITSGYNLKRLDKLDALKESITWFAERGEDELSGYAKIRYIQNLQIAWYHVNSMISGEEDVEKQLLEEHQKALNAYWDEVKNRASLFDRFAVRTFCANPKLYRFFAREYRVFVGERN